MKNKLILGLAVFLLISTAVFGRDYTLDESANIALSGIDEITFDLRNVSCSLCIRSLNLQSDVLGDGRGGDMELVLSGNISSNRDGAIPSLIIEETSRSVTVRLYPRRNTFFGLSQSGTAYFEALVPESFEGKVSIIGASDDVNVEEFIVESMNVRSSSGDLTVRNVTADQVNLAISSGDFRGDGISGGSVSVDSSSGDIGLGRISGNDLVVEASSGDITIGEMTSEDQVSIKASSGRIGVGILRSPEAGLRSSSGRITVDDMEVGIGTIQVSSGDVSLDSATADDLSIELSSGELTIGRLDGGATDIKTSSDTRINRARGALTFKGSSGDVDISFEAFDDPAELNVSSGDITLALPSDAAFDAVLDTSSGKIRSEFGIIGDLSADGDEIEGTVNGGGVLLNARTSSGNIKLLSK